MKIGIDIRNIGKKRTGDEVVFFGLVKNLAEIDSLNNYKLFTDIIDTETLSDIKKRLGIENKNNFEIIPLKTANKFIWNLWTLPKHLRQNPVDVYLTQYITPFFVPKSVKIATIIHDISFNFYAKYIKFSDLFFLKLLIPLSLRRADKIIGVSQFTRDEVIKYYGIRPEKTDWIHNAVSDNFFAEISAEKLQAVRKKYNLPEKFILYVGTLQPRKNLPALVRAYAEIKDRFPELKLVLAGNRNGHNFDKNIDVAIQQCGLSALAGGGSLQTSADVVFPGFIDEDDKPAVFRLASIFCFPSFYEGFGVPILEAMASGIPTVISEIPPHKEIAADAALYFNPVEYCETVSCQGRISHGVNPRDLAGLAEKLYNVFMDESLRNKLIVSGEIRAKAFSWRKSAIKLLGILQK